MLYEGVHLTFHAHLPPLMRSVFSSPYWCFRFPFIVGRLIPPLLASTFFFYVSPPLLFLLTSVALFF